MARIDRAALRQKIQELAGLSDDERAALLQLVADGRSYGLVWEDRAEEVEERLREELPVLVEDASLRIIGQDIEHELPRMDNELEDNNSREINGNSCENESPNHILIEGDNLEALTALSYTHEGRVDVIYIDPPYNTGNRDFVYNDSFVDSEDSYRHSKWLSFMSKRLRIAKRLLSDRGVIFISIDDNEQANLKLLCDQVFGERLFVTDLIWRSSDSSNHDSKKFSVDYNHTLVYSKNDDWQPLKISRTEDNNAHYKNPDNDPNGPWFPSNLQSPNPRANLMFDIISPQGHSIHAPQKGWRWSKEKMQEFIDNGAIVFVDNGKRLIKKTYLKDQQGLVPSNIWWDIEETGHNRNAKYELKKIFPELQTSEIFSTPKPTKFIKKILAITSYSSSTVLDFFAGSGTTLHAVMQLNKEDGGHRQCILVTNNENNICREVTYERNKRVICGYTTLKGVPVEGLRDNNLRYYRTRLLPRERTNKNMRALVNAATDLLCIKEGLFEERKAESGKRKAGLTPKDVRLFSDGERAMMVVYNEEAIPDIVDWLLEEQHELPRIGHELEDNNSRNINGNSRENKIKVYVFSPGAYAWDDDFAPVLDRVELCALPEAIYQAYKNVLPKKRRPGSVTSEAEKGGEE